MSDYRDDRGQLRTRLEEAEAELAQREAELERERQRVVELGARLADHGKQIERLREENVATAGQGRAELAKRRRTTGTALLASAGVAAVLAMTGGRTTTAQTVLLGYALVAGTVGLIFVTLAF